mgnify:CR=1 FL=1
MLKVFLFWPKRDKMGMILKGGFPAPERIYHDEIQ